MLTHPHGRLPRRSLVVVGWFVIALAWGDPAQAATATQTQSKTVVNINQATAKQLTLLPGIGPALAQRIVAYRARRPFRSIRELRRVRGIGRRKFARIKPLVTTTGATTLASKATARPAPKPKHRTADAAR